MKSKPSVIVKMWWHNVCKSALSTGRCLYKGRDSCFYYWLMILLGSLRIMWPRENHIHSVPPLQWEQRDRRQERHNREMWEPEGPEQSTGFSGLRDRVRYCSCHWNGKPREGAAWEGDTFSWDVQAGRDFGTFEVQAAVNNQNRTWMESEVWKLSARGQNL